MRKVQPSVWKDRRVFLTGHTGFKGGWLSLWLLKLGARITGYSLPPPTKPSFFEVTNLPKHMESVEGDIRDYEHLLKSFQESKPEVVFHLAAQPLVRYSYQEPLLTYATNVMGTAHILEAARKSSSVKAVIIITTDKCYENKEWIWPYRENDRLGGRDPYSNSKACAELVTSAYRASFFEDTNVGIASVRAGNVIGGGDWAKDRLIPDLFRAVEKAEALELRYPKAVRPWQHVLEPLHGYLLTAESLLEDKMFAEGWNFGPSNSEMWTVEEIIKKATEFWGPSARYKIHPEAHTKTHLHESGLLRLDSSKAQSLLRWEAKWGIERSLQETLVWYKKYLEVSTNLFDFSSQQVDAYLD